MFELRLLETETATKFNQQLPVFNWHYPFDADEGEVNDLLIPFTSQNTNKIKRRAAYIHIPFCETICNFCPFVKEKYSRESQIDEYINALAAEFELKRSVIGVFAPETIAVGGGTPSLLNERQIEALGSLIEKNFDTRKLKEFTFELEVKSVTPEKLYAMRNIGVNRISLGAQTFSEIYRKLFSLDATKKQILSSAALANSIFKYTNVDLLYGLAGQTVAQLYDDARLILDLQTTTVDVYPINNLTARRSMHRAVSKNGLSYLPATTRTMFRVHLDRFFRDHGYRAISGYGYAKALTADVVIQHAPKFIYHDLVYGYHDDQIVGYGLSAISQMQNYNLYNSPHISSYVQALLVDGTLPHKTVRAMASPERGIVLFPYRGKLDKRKVPWELIPDETWVALHELEVAGLVVNEPEEYVLSKLGWLFYVNLMYYLMPNAAKRKMSNIIASHYNGRKCGDTTLGGELEELIDL